MTWLDWLNSILAGVGILACGLRIVWLKTRPHDSETEGCWRKPAGFHGYRRERKKGGKNVCQ